jgi:hypothetical protein
MAGLQGSVMQIYLTDLVSDDLPLSIYLFALMTFIIEEPG